MQTNQSVTANLPTAKPPDSLMKNAVPAGTGNGIGSNNHKVTEYRNPSKGQVPFSALGTLPQWVAWDLKDGRKLPINPHTGDPAKSNIPATWGTRQQAEACRKRIGGNGVGLMLGPVQGLDGVNLGGIDLDSCRNTATGDLAPWAQAVLDCYPTYTEISPSGTGVKLYFTYSGEFKGRVFRRPRVGDAKAEAIEVFARTRFFAFTGDELSDDIFADAAPLTHFTPDQLHWVTQVHGPAFAGVDAVPDHDAPQELKEPLGLSVDEIRDRLKLLDKEKRVIDYHGWIQIGMALHHETGGSDEGLDLWFELSESYPGASYEEHDTKWDGFNSKRPGVTLRTILHETRQVHLAGSFDDLGLDDSCPRIQATPFVYHPLASLPKREWLYGKHYGRKLLSAMAATGGTGKSVLLIAESLAIAAGKPLLGETVPDGPKTVWHINSEDDTGELDRRFAGASEHYDLQQSGFEGRLFYTGNETRFVVASEGRDGLKIARPIVDDIKAEIRRLGIDVLTIDPFVSTHAVSENSNSSINAVACLWRDIAIECDCSVTLVHHMRKPASAKPGQSQTSFSVDDARGAVAFKDAARVFRVINRMSDSRAAELGITDAWRHLHVTDGKANYAPPATAGRWFMLETVGAQGDDSGVGVVVPWEHPVARSSQGDILQGLACLKDGTARVDTRSPQSGAKRVSAAMGWTEGVAKEHLKAWVKAGYLKTETRDDEQRRPREFYTLISVPKSDFEDTETE